MKRSTLAIFLAGSLVAGGAMSVAFAQDGSSKAPHKAGKHKHHMMAARLAEFDSNSDGKLSQEEIEEGRKSHFAAADSNSDGQLTQAEMQAFHETMREARKQQRQAEMFAKVDKDGSGTLSMTEFLEGRPMDFDRMDRNDDGFISKDDFEGRRKWKDK